MFKEYEQLIVSFLEAFLEKEKVEAESIFETCKKMIDLEENTLFCIDYLVAALEYENFYAMMGEYAVIS